MILTEDNFNVFAAAYYDNPFCLSEEEFLEDLRQHVTIRRMISKYMKETDINIKLLVNNIIIFYNCFEHHAASQMLEFKMNEHHWPKMNAILYFLSFPLIGDGQFDVIFHRQIAQEFKHL